MPDANPVFTADDLKFLVEFRDYLNSAASPASGSTIAFSIFVSDGAAGHRMTDAKRAYPGYRTLARKLRWSMYLLQYGALAATVLVALMGAYVYWGNAIVASASSAISQQTDLAKDIAREEATGITRLASGDYQAAPAGSLFPTEIVHITGAGASAAGPGAPNSMGFLGLCDAIAHSSFGGNGVQVFLSSTQEYLCTQNTNITRELGDFQREAKTWYQFSHHVLPYQSKSLSDPVSLLHIAPHELSVINGYAIALAMGFLGSAAFILRRYLQRLGDRELTTRDFDANGVRLVLGVLSGLAVGFFFSPSGNSSSLTDTVGLGINLTTPALAFLAGYAVEILFKFLDTLAGRTFAMK